MGHKVHPYGYRLGYTHTWTAKWYADKEYTTLLREDIAIRQLLERINGKSPPHGRVVVMAPKLTVRASTVGYNAGATSL